MLKYLNWYLYLNHFDLNRLFIMYVLRDNKAALWHSAFSNNIPKQQSLTKQLLL